MSATLGRVLARASYQWNRSGELTHAACDWELGEAASLMRRVGLPQAKMDPFEVRFARNGLGQEVARRLPGGVSAVWTRDAFARPTEHRVVTGASRDRPGRDVLLTGYTWQSPEQIASLIEHDPPSGIARRSTSYEYDPRGHLIRQLFSNGEVIERQSDAVGNLWKSRDGSDRMYGRGGVLESAGGTRFTHDADGFLVEKVLADGAKWLYAWDAQGRLEQVTRPDGKEVRFAYDAFGRRVRKSFDGKTTEYVWDGDDLLHERTTDAEGRVAPLITWLFEPGTFAPLAKIEGRKRFGIVTDHLGTPTMLTTEVGEIAWKAQLDIYGVVRDEPEGVSAEHKTKNPWRYPGQYEDEETGLYYNRFRYYDPEIGRYISEDPIGLLGGAAQYGYVHDPLGWFDPLGLNGSCGRLSKRLRNKKARIENQLAARGNRGISGVLTQEEAMALGKEFVGKRYRESVLPNGSRLLISDNGLRQFRAPSPKRGVNPVTGEAWSRTGRQSNFESRDSPEGPWTSNVHADVE